MVLEESNDKQQLFRRIILCGGQFQFPLGHAALTLAQQIESAVQVNIIIGVLADLLQKILLLRADEHFIRGEILCKSQGQGNRPEVLEVHAEAFLVAFQQLTQVEKPVLLLEAAAILLIQERAAPEQRRPFRVGRLRRIKDESNDVVKQGQIDLGVICF